MEPWPGFNIENKNIMAEIYAFKQEFFDNQIVLMKAKGLAYFQDRCDMDKCQFMSYAYEALIYYKNENQVRKYKYIRHLLNQLSSNFPTTNPSLIADDYFNLMKEYGLDYFLKRKKGEELFYVSCAYELLIYYMQEEQYEKCSFIQYLIGILKNYFPRIMSYSLVDNLLTPVVTYTKMSIH